MSTESGLTAGVTTLMRGIKLGESPRWHGGKLWFADWVGETLFTVVLHGRTEIVARLRTQAQNSRLATPRRPCLLEAR